MKPGPRFWRHGSKLNAHPFAWARSADYGSRAHFSPRNLKVKFDYVADRRRIGHIDEQSSQTQRSHTGEDTISRALPGNEHAAG